MYKIFHTAKVKKDSRTKPDSWWMDEQQLEQISEGINKKITPTETGGPSERSDTARM